MIQLSQVLTLLKEDLIALKPNENHMKFPKHMRSFQETAGPIYMEQNLHIILTENLNITLNFCYNFQVIFS